MKDIEPLINVIPKEKTYLNMGMDYRIAKSLKENFDIKIGNDCYIWILNEPNSEHSTLESLTLNDAEFINENWSYKHTGSINFIEHLLSSFPSSVIRGEDKEPIGWGFCYAQNDSYSNLGGLFVKEDYRRKGFASKITSDLCNKIHQTGRIPLVHINIDNQASTNLISTKISCMKRERVIFGTLNS